jgi:putative transposase
MDAARSEVRHGRERGSVTLGGRRAAVTRRRARTVDGTQVPRATYQAFAAEGSLVAVVMEKMRAMHAWGVWNGADAMGAPASW